MNIRITDTDGDVCVLPYLDEVEAVAVGNDYIVEPWSVSETGVLHTDSLTIEILRPDLGFCKARGKLALAVKVDGKVKHSGSARSLAQVADALADRNLDQMQELERILSA